MRRAVELRRSGAQTPESENERRGGGAQSSNDSCLCPDLVLDRALQYGDRVLLTGTFLLQFLWSYWRAVLQAQSCLV